MGLCCGKGRDDDYEAPPEPEPEPELGPEPEPELQQVNQYVLVEQIGRGTFGTVWRAQTRSEGGEVEGTFAVKRMDMMFLRKKMRGQRARGGGADEMVKREIATMKKLDHPNIARLVDVIEDGEPGAASSTMYVVSEFLAHGSLEERRRSQPSGALPMDELRRVSRQMLAALNYLHTVVQIAHRDIKPENVMLDGEEVVKLIDFGTAEIFTMNPDGSPSDFTSKAAGTPAFYAPEMCSIDIDSYEMLPTDVWALGVTMYQLAYGALPFKETGLMQLMEEIDTKEVEYPELKPPADGCPPPPPSAGPPSLSPTRPRPLKLAWAVSVTTVTGRCCASCCRPCSCGSQRRA